LFTLDEIIHRTLKSIKRLSILPLVTCKFIKDYKRLYRFLEDTHLKRMTRKNVVYFVFNSIYRDLHTNNWVTGIKWRLKKNWNSK
jgi:hypothetical protein